jgi:hypothetical protein
MGVYEPLVCIVDGRIVRSSRAADPGLLERAEVSYHAGCFEQRLAAVHAA